jgi:GDYXXLXY protein
VTLKDDSQGIHLLKPPFFAGVKKGDRVTRCCDGVGNVFYLFKQQPGYKQECRGQELAGTVEEIKEAKFRNLQVDDGIESYFVEEGTGKIIESARNAREAKVEVSLRKDGKGIITGLIMGERILR